MKYVRKTGENRYMASITIGSGALGYVNKHRKSNGINVSLGTFPSEQEAHNAALSMRERLAGVYDYSEQRNIVTAFRKMHMQKERNICCGVKIRPGWNMCPVCGRKFSDTEMTA